MLDPLSRAIEKAASERRSNLPSEEPKPSSRDEIPTLGLDRLEYTQTPIHHLPNGSLRPHLNPESKEGIAARNFDILKTKVLQKLEQQHSNLLVVTSPGVSNGKTTTAVHLAASIARSVDHSVLLVDLDLRHPSIHKFFAVSPEKGVTDLINGNADFSDVAFNPGVPRLVVVPGRESITHSTEFLSTPAIKRFIDEVRDRYPKRIIIFDLPPVLGGADVLSFIPHVDNYLLVLEAGKTSKRELNDTKKALAGSTIIGTVLNRSQEPQNAYY